jgi:hypothetical protein
MKGMDTYNINSPPATLGEIIKEQPKRSEYKILRTMYASTIDSQAQGDIKSHVQSYVSPFYLTDEVNESSIRERNMIIY